MADCRSPAVLYGVYRVRLRCGLRAAISAATLLLAGCNTSGGGAVATPAIQTSADALSIKREAVAFSALVARGYHYRFSGRLSNINVAFVNGRTIVVGTAAPGDYLDVSFQLTPATIFAIGGSTKRLFVNQPGCVADCGPQGNQTPPPSPQATDPPNYGACFAAGGATWFDQTTGNGGCLGPGGSKGLPCGIWSFDTPGKGRFRSWDGTLDEGGWKFISLNTDGQTCHLGY